MFLPGIIYIAPPDYPVLVEKNRAFSLDDSQKVNYRRPSIDVSFESVAQVFRWRAVGILLLETEADGVEGLKLIRQEGGMRCVQDPSTAGIPIIPSQATASMGIDRVLKSEELAGFIESLQ